VQWSIGHQGARVWTGDGNNSLLSGETLRISLLGATNNSNLLESHPAVDQAVSELRNATTELLERATTDAVNKCVKAFPIDDAFQHFNWVATHEAKIWELDDAHKAKNYDLMRSIFSNTQKDNDDLRNKLYCYSGRNIDELMARLGPVPPKTKPPTPPHHPPAGGIGGGHPDKK
jgi:hypothetical protein